MQAIRVVALETFLRLRRDQIFAPFLVFSFGFFFFAYILSGLTIEDGDRILIDLSRFVLNFFGSSVAIYWGVMLLSIHEDGLEYRLLCPYPRWHCLVGAYFGLCSCLGILLLFFLVNWLIIIYVLNSHVLSWHFLFVFFLQMLGWFVTAAQAMFISTFCGTFVALFSSFLLFISGVISALVAKTLPVDTPFLSKIFVEFFASVWDMQIFNPSFDIILTNQQVSAALAYAGILILVFLFLASVFVTRRDYK